MVADQIRKTWETYGNADVIKRLEEVLALARQDPTWRFVVVAMAKPTEQYIISPGTEPITRASFVKGYAGDPYLEPFGLKIATEFTKMFDEVNRNYYEPPPRNPELGADYWCYSLIRNNISFDFLNAILVAEMNRIKEGAPAPLKVGFWPGWHPTAGMNLERRMAWLKNVFRPCLKLVGAVEEARAVGGRPCGQGKEWYLDLVSRVAAGERLPDLNTPPEYLDKMREFAGCVTITLRETHLCVERNSRLEEWTKFAQWLEARGERVVVVRDTAFADAPLWGCKQILPVASRDTLARAALYELAKANCFIATGPSMLGLFGKRPCFVMVELKGDEFAPYWPNTPKMWREHIGIEVGGQFPWSRPDQFIMWEPDTFDNLKAAWERLEECIAQNSSPAILPAWASHTLGRSESSTLSTTP